MRTVIQAIDAFPTLVDFVMEILSKLVRKQIWRLPKLWPGFLKCVSQTKPHSFPVLLELPVPQLESIMKKFPDLRPSLTAYANQPTIRSSLPNSALSVLGLDNGQDSRSQMHPSDATSSIHGAALT
jgi:symplekin